MQTVSKITLAVLAAFSINAFAGLPTAPTCVEAYEKIAPEYLANVNRLETAMWGAGVVTGVGAGGVIAVCAITNVAIIPCLASISVPAVAYAYRWESFRTLQKLESMTKLNIVYKNIKSGTDSREVQEFVDLLGVDEPNAQKSALVELTRLMESGQFCKRGWYSGEYKAGMKLEAVAMKLKRRYGSASY